VRRDVTAAVLTEDLAGEVLAVLLTAVVGCLLHIWHLPSLASPTITIIIMLLSH
jgi:hypothetical protein